MTDRVVHWRRLAGEAALPFEQRWTWLALRRVNPDLARRLHEQRGLFDEACVTGDRPDVEEHGAALCRGYAAAVKALEQADEPDDAYMLGRDVSGLIVAVGHQRAAAARVRDLHGERAVWVTPDEVARLMASVEQFKFVGAVKRFFPGAEIIDRYEDQPDKAELQ